MAQSRAAQIRLEEQLNLCIARIEQLELRVNQLESERSESVFELVTDTASVPLPASEPSSSSASVSSSRVLVLEQIGGWIKTCLEGRRRGLSGREKLSEGNSVYLVFRGFSGQTFNPVRVFTRYAEVLPVVKPSGDIGDSIFIGLPSFEDARIVAAAAGVRLEDQ